jgi:hypothetical protein
MPERDGYIPGVPCWVDTTQPDPEAAVAFYSRLFGWELENVMPPGSESHYSIARIRGGDVAAVASPPDGAPPVAMWNTYIWVDDAGETAAKILKAGGEVLQEPFPVMDAGRMAVVADPEGAIFCLWQAGQHRGARVVNEHGAVNFNGLNTRDVEATKRFYGAVFGWGTMTLDGGGAEMWTLPGYGDYLERDQPGLRERVAEMGGQAEFVDVVANISPIPADQPDTPPHWDVTFGIDNVDVAAEKASALGGTVLMPPTDVPWSRIAVIADPQGAVFIASEFVPENRDLAARVGESAAAA